MKERPILFSAPMVRAILNGSKTQTRRLVPEWQLPKQTSGEQAAGLEWISIAQRDRRYGFGVFGATESECMANYSNDYSSLCPYGRKGDQLWVRESCYRQDGADDKHSVFVNGYAYAADLAQTMRDYVRQRGAKSVPSIHMPRKASRIQLEIVSVRVERLQDISPVDAIAEGIEPIPQVGPMRAFGWKCYHGGIGHFDPYASFCSLWEKINGEQSWEDNPWVWVVEFKRVV